MILIVDDDRAVRMSIKLMLERAGMVCETAGDERSALEAVREREPQLIILDMNLTLETTGRQGIEMLRKFRVLVPDVPVILITAWGTISLAVEGMSLGAANFITKPWRNVDFLAQVRKALKDAEKAGEERNRVPTLEEVERSTVIEAIDRCNGNMSAAAELLGITRQALYRRVQKYGLPVDYKPRT
ncbi:MAG: response regulator [Bacteroides sp.]|nr:response regulator [Bacteroides sp.]